LMLCCQKASQEVLWGLSEQQSGWQRWFRWSGRILSVRDPGLHVRQKCLNLHFPYHLSYNRWILNGFPLPLPGLIIKRNQFR